MEKIKEALYRFKELVDSLECECDDYYGYICPIHKDRLLVRSALKSNMFEKPNIKKNRKKEKGEKL